MTDRYQLPPEGFELPSIETAPAPAVEKQPERYTAPPSGYSLPDLPGAPAGPKPIPEVPKGPLSALQVVRSAQEHFIPSAKKAGEELVYPFLHPSETWEGAKTLTSGLASKAAPAFGLSYQDPKSEEAVNTIGQFYKDRYGGIEQAKRTFAEDPVGFASDAAMALTGVGGAARLPLKGAQIAGQTSKVASGLGKVGELIGETGRLIDPVTAAANLTSMGGELVTKGVTPAMFAFKSGKTMQSLRAAEEAGATSNPEFFRHLYGEGTPHEVVDSVKTSIDNIKDERSRAYLNTSQGWKSNQTPLNTMTTELKYNDLVSQYMPTGKNAKVAEYMEEPLQKIRGILDRYAPTNKTMSDLDLMKRDLDKLYYKPEFHGPEAKAALTDIRNEVWQTIVDHDPQYAKIMQNYENATKELNEIVSEVGTNKASATTRLKKLIKASDKGTIDRLLQDNPNLSYMIAGQELRPLMPEGLRGALLSTVGYTLPSLVTMNPAALSALVGVAGASPKVAGTLQAGLGAARALPKQAERAAVPQAVRRATMAAQKPFIGNVEFAPEEQQAHGGRIYRASGGRAGITVDALIGAVEASKKRNQDQTKAILESPDEHVVKALKVANENI